MHPNLSVQDIITQGADTIVVVKACQPEDRYFPPLLAAQIFLDVRGLIHQDCDSKPIETGKPGSKEGNTQVSRRWAFAQEIFSNNGRGTESGHFLEHLILQIATNLREDGYPPLYGETSWDFRVEPDVFRIHFYEVQPDVIGEALFHSSDVLSQWGYQLDLGPHFSAP